MQSIITWLSGLTVAGKFATGFAAFMTLGAVGSVVAPVEEVQEITPPPIEQVQGITEVLPIVSSEFVTETESIAFETEFIDDPTINKGESRTITKGIKGEKELVYLVTYTDGEETSRLLQGETITKQPRTQVIANGTFVFVPPAAAPTTSGCDPNYSGCVPIDSDVDCAGGSGNGPSYAVGPVTVIGSDIYGLDRDNDGIGCE
jgi:hypothetical protein